MFFLHILPFKKNFKFMFIKILLHTPFSYIFEKFEFSFPILPQKKKNPCSSMNRNEIRRNVENPKWHMFISTFWNDV